jgi:sulfite reductase (NADPH) flavoprotein alpha-component
MTADSQRLLAAVSVVLLHLVLCAAIFAGQRRKARQAARDAAALKPAADGTEPMLVAFASQTGFAEQLAWQTARSLHTAGLPARVAMLSELTADDLRTTTRALFIASTSGEGDPPDGAALFVRRVMATEPSLASLHYGLLSLGDRGYSHFCGFGKTLDGWLAQCGAQPLFARVEVDNGDEAALAQWQQHLARIAGTSDLPDWQAPAFERWRLAARHHLNPGSAGAPTFHVELEPLDGVLPDWQSGDLVQVQVPVEGERPREYSIASLPSDGRIHLLMRQQRRTDGRLGLASGWLTAQAELGSEISLRLRPHRNFHLADNVDRPLILIGNGTGLAGLRGHLKARVQAGQGRNWLIFGERQAAHDAYYRDEIDAWEASGAIEQADLVFSRDQPQRRYVQDQLRASAANVKSWLSAGAAVYVCGSLEGMAHGVEAALNDIIGAEAVQRLAEMGRYRRDVY